MFVEEAPSAKSNRRDFSGLMAEAHGNRTRERRVGRATTLKRCPWAPEEERHAVVLFEQVPPRSPLSTSTCAMARSSSKAVRGHLLATVWPAEYSGHKCLLAKRIRLL